MKLNNPLGLFEASVAQGAIVPIPTGGGHNIIWSTTTSSILHWDGTSWQPLTAPSSSSGNKVFSQVDFGLVSGGESDAAKVTVAAAWANSTTSIICSVRPTPTTDHDPEDYAIEGLSAYAINVVDGVGFDVVVSAPRFTFGKYNVQAIGV